MTGAHIVATILASDAPLGAKVPAGNVKLGRIAVDMLPALLVRTVSVVDRQPLQRKGWVRRTDRVSVTVRAASYRDQVSLIKMVRECCIGRVGDLAGGKRVSILSGGVGPDVNGPGDSFEQTQDLRVSFDEQA